MSAWAGAEDPSFELLAAVAEVADGSLSLDTTVQRLLEIVVPAFADLALLDAMGPGGGLRRLGVRVEAANRAELEEAVLRRRRVNDAPVGVAHAVARGVSQLLSPITDEHLRLIASTDDDLERLRSLALGSAVFVPLRARGQILGAFACAVGSSGRHYDTGDLRFAEVLAGRISLALDNAGLSQTVSELQRQLESTLENLGEAVIVRDPAGRMVFANSAAATLLGFESFEEIQSASAADLMRRYNAFDESGRTLELADLPSAAAMGGEVAEPLLVRNVVRQTGEEHWLLHRATPVFTHEGKLSLVVNVIEDVTEVKRAELAQRLLAQAGSELSSSLHYQQTLQRVATLAVPQLADWCGVRIRGPHDELEQVAVAHNDPGKVALAREFGERNPPRLTDTSGAAEVIRTGDSRLLREITPEMIALADASEEQAALARDLQMRSAISVPLAVPGQSPLGVMSLVMAESGRLFDERDLALAEELARRAAVAVENARLYSERCESRARFSRVFCPRRFPRSRVSGWPASTGRREATAKSGATSMTCSRSRPDGWFSSAM